MKKQVKLIFLFSTLFLFVGKSKAAIGCLSSSTTYTYINATGGYVSGAAEYYHRYESDRRTTASNFCTTPIVPSSPCYITSTRSGYTSSPGTRVNYSTYDNCAVDDNQYLDVLFLSLGGVAFYAIKRKTYNLI